MDLLMQSLTSIDEACEVDLVKNGVGDANAPSTDNHIEDIYCFPVPSNVSGAVDSDPVSLSPLENSVDACDRITEDDVLQKNIEYQSLIQKQLQLVSKALEANKLKQIEIDKKLLEKEKDSSDSKTKKAERGMKRFTPPYFRDVDGNGPRMSDDQLQFEVTHQGWKQRRWSTKYKRMVVQSVREELQANLLRPISGKREFALKRLKDAKEEQDVEKIAKFTKMIKDVEWEVKRMRNMTDAELFPGLYQTDKIDFHSVSITAFDGKYSADDAKNLWMNAAHPLINRSCWKYSEKQKLRESCRSDFEWLDLARTLGTNRTVLQLMQKYVQLDEEFSECNYWDGEQCALLRSAVEEIRLGDYVDWHKVAEKVKCHSAEECEKRWQITHASLGVGQWTVEEEIKLLAAARLLGTKDWCLLSGHVGTRNRTQCRDHYMSKLHRTTTVGRFTYFEDKFLYLNRDNRQIINSEYKNHFPARTTNQLVKRIMRLKMYREEWEELSKLPDDALVDLLRSKIRQYMLNCSRTGLEGASAAEQIFHIVHYRRQLRLLNGGSRFYKDLNETRMLRELLSDPSKKASVELVIKEEKQRQMDESAGLFIPRQPPTRHQRMSRVGEMNLSEQMAQHVDRLHSVVDKVIHEVIDRGSRVDISDVVAQTFNILSQDESFNRDADKAATDLLESRSSLNVVDGQHGVAVQPTKGKKSRLSKIKRSHQSAEPSGVCAKKRKIDGQEQQSNEMADEVADLSNVVSTLTGETAIDEVADLSNVVSTLTGEMADDEVADLSNVASCHKFEDEIMRFMRNNRGDLHSRHPYFSQFVSPIKFDKSRDDKVQIMFLKSLQANLGKMKNQAIKLKSISKGGQLPQQMQLARHFPGRSEEFHVLSEVLMSESFAKQGRKSAPAEIPPVPPCAATLLGLNGLQKHFRRNKIPMESESDGNSVSALCQPGPSNECGVPSHGLQDLGREEQEVINTYSSNTKCQNEQSNAEIDVDSMDYQVLRRRLRAIFLWPLIMSEIDVSSTQKTDASDESVR